MLKNILKKLMLLLIAGALMFQTGVLTVTALAENISIQAAASEWDPSMPLPDRPLTPEELHAWNVHYCDLGITEIEMEILRLTNIERANYGLAPLVIDYQLSRAARFKSQEMVDLQYFAHESPVYGNFFNIPLLFIDSFGGLAENLTVSINQNRTAAQMVQGWMNSPGHRANILNPEMTTLGVGVVSLPPAGMGFRNEFGTQMFGRDVISTPFDCSPILYTLTVENGTGGGLFAAGATVSITATVPAGQRFVRWEGSNTVTFADPTSSSTTFTMPASNVTVTAVYEPTGNYNAPRDTLRELIEEAEARDPGNYTPRSWANKLSMLTFARNVYNNQTATDAQINDAINNLRARLDALEPR